MNFFDFSEIHGKSMEINAKMKKISLQKVDLVCICEFLRGANGHWKWKSRKTYFFEVKHTY